MPFGSYEASPELAFANAAHLLKETGAAAVKIEGGRVLAPTVEFLTSRGIPVMAHVGNLKRIGNVWKFKAIGYDANGKVIPRGGPLTDRHNTPFATSDAAEVSQKLGLMPPGATPPPQPTGNPP